MSHTSARTRRNLMFTLNIQVNRYFRMYEDHIKTEKDIDQLIENVFFYWIRDSSERNYIWTKDTDSIAELNNRNSEFRKRIKRMMVKKIQQRN